MVAWLSQLNPLVIGIASFLLAGLRVGLETLQLDLQVPAAFGAILEGLILLTVLAGGFFSRYEIRRRGVAPALARPQDKQHPMNMDFIIPLLAAAIQSGTPIFVCHIGGNRHRAVRQS